MLEEPSPVKIDGYRCHVLDTKVDLYLAPYLLPMCILLGRMALRY